MLIPTRHSPDRGDTRGFVLLEVLISILILAFGLLGLAKLQASTRQLEMESYQRAQAVVLLQDMVSRLSANVKAADCYAISDLASGSPWLGKDATNIPTSCSYGTATQQAAAAKDLTDWNNMLLGVSEVDQSSGANEGAMIDARGCISYDAANNVYVVTVVWQGLMATSTPSGLSCGSNQYSPADARRAVSAVVRVPTLS